MKKIFILIPILFILTGCCNTINEIKEVFQIVKEDRGLHEWDLLKIQDIDDEIYLFYIDSEKNLNLIKFRIKNNKYYMHILYNTDYINSEDYTYEDYDFLGIYKKNNEWKIDYIS